MCIRDRRIAQFSQERSEEGYRLLVVGGKYVTESELASWRKELDKAKKLLSIKLAKIRGWIQAAATVTYTHLDTALDKYCIYKMQLQISMGIF